MTFPSTLLLTYQQQDLKKRINDKKAILDALRPLSPTIIDVNDVASGRKVAGHIH